MNRKPMALGVCALLASSASLAIDVRPYQASLNVIASQLALDLGLPDGGLDAFFPNLDGQAPGEQSLIATVKNAAKLNALKDVGGASRGDFVKLTTTADPGRWKAELYAQGDSWENPNLRIGVDVDYEFKQGCERSGVHLPAKKLASLEGAQLVGTVDDPAAFAESFGGRVPKGTTVVLTPGSNGSRAVAGHGSPDMPIWLRVDGGKVQSER